MTPAQPQGPPAPKSDKRRGIVIVAVLIVVASLALMGYHYSDMMTSEYKASHNSHRAVQAQRAAESGVHYAAALLSNPQNYAGLLNGNPWNNPTAFRDIAVPGDTKANGRFSLIAAPDVDGNDPSEVIFGVTDESGKVNLNALMKLDPTGQVLYGALIQLPNMTEDIANSIVAWMGGSYGSQNNGALSDYYLGLPSPYRAKGGPLDSIDELLLVKGVTRGLLYGTDLNRNGMRDGAEGGADGFSRGWSACLTVYSREPNHDANGNPYIYLKNADLSQLYNDLLQQEVDEDLAKFIILHRQYSQANSSGTGTQSLGSTIVAALLGGGKPSTNTKTVQGDLSTYEVKFTRSGSKPFISIFDLIESKIIIPKKVGNTTVNTVYTSPLADPAKQRELLPKLFAIATMSADPEMPARININTAPMAVLSCIPGLTPEDVQKIVATRPNPFSTDPPGEAYSSPAWLLTEAQLNVKVLSALENFITARTSVYRVQSVGYGDGKGPSVRVEAVIDTNAGRPRIIVWRDLSELGKGLPTMAANP